MDTSQSIAAFTTYEARKAQEWNASQADKIHWEKGKAYRNQNYRSLFHQQGRIGTLEVRLLEAAELKRSYWSALALGPMKHLGLSKAHGGVSSFVSFCLDTSNTRHPMSSLLQEDDVVDTNLDRKMPAKNSGDGSRRHPSQLQQNPLYQMPVFVSPVKQQDNNPVWTNCNFDLPLKKGVLEDGQPVRIFLRVDEESTALDKIPGIPSGGDRLLGVGTLDVTSLCLGQVPLTGRPSAGVIDEWVPIRLPADIEEESSIMKTTAAEQDLLWQHAKNGGGDLKNPPPKNSSNKEDKIRGRVRILVTYRPHGMSPQEHDIVALEAFARQNLQTTTCTPVLPPLIPMKVLEVSEPWLLVEYSLLFGIHGVDIGHDHNGRKDDKACMRVHRNAVFVIERKNLLDATLNVALQPADFLLSTPLGHGAQEILGPLFVAGKQLMMPALLSSKLIWMVVRTTALASITGVAAAGSAFVSEGTNSLTNDGSESRQRKTYDENGKREYISL